MPEDSKHHLDIQSQSLHNQDLARANFANQNISGTDFTDAQLTNANFCEIQAGSSPLFNFLQSALSASLALASGCITAYAGAVLGNSFSIFTPSSIFVGSIIGISLIIFWYKTLKKGFNSELGLATISSATIVIVLIAIIPNIDFAEYLLLGSLSLFGSMGGVMGLATAIYLNQSSPLSLGIASLGIILGTSLGIHAELYTLADFAGVFLISLITLILAQRIAHHTNPNDDRHQLIHNLTIALSTPGSTSFKNADLTNANFTNADLRNTDFRGANLTRTNWRNAKNLDRANLERTYLENPTIRRLLTSGNGQNQNLQKLDLSNLNLDNANLSGADLRNANLNNSTLRNANLSRAKLAQAQLYGVDLSGANLTGAFIQNWGISPETIFDNVQCDYIHMRLPTDQDPDPCRKPDNKSETFRPGDFADFIAPIIRTLDSYQQQNLDPRTLLAPKTLDLYHYEGIDPSAAAIALQQLIETNPQAAIEVRAIEGRGYQKVRIQAQVANSADPSQLNADYFDCYQNLATLAYPDLQNLLNGLEAKDSRIRSLESMVKNALGSDRFYAESITPVIQPKNILLLAANPKDTTRLRTSEEVREIQNGLDRARHRDKFLLQQRWAVTVRELQQILIEQQPHIVHFSGHGVGATADRSSPSNTNEGLVFENEQGHAHLVPGQALADLFQIITADINPIDCIILNACYSQDQANAIVQHVPYVIGMNRAIGDRAAIEFSVGFYNSLLAGHPIETAFKLGCNAIQLQGIPEHLTPVLKRRTVQT